MSVEAICAKAERALKGNWLSKLMKSTGAQYDEAVDLYVQAANQAKLEKKWTLSADCFKKAAGLCKLMEETHRQAQLLVEAGHVLKRESADEAAVPYDEAAELQASAGKFGMAGRVWKTLAEQYESEGDLANAKKYYDKAAGVFDMDEYSKTATSACRLKVAAYTARLERNYPLAIEIYEDEAQKAVKNSLGAFSAKDYLFNAGILRMVSGDDVDMSISLENFRRMDPRFANSREGKLLDVLIEAYKDQDVKSFVSAIAEYENVSPLDDWRVHFLSLVKDKFPEEGNATGTVSTGGGKVLVENSDDDIDLS